MFEGMKRWLGINKWRMALGYSVLGIPAMGLVVAKTVSDIIKPYIYIPMWILYPSGVIILWFCGYLYDRTGTYSQEVDYMSERNLYFEKYLRGKKKK